MPWRCHRSLIADALLVRGITVMDIMGKNSLREHSLTPWADVDDGNKITYPGSKLAAAPPWYGANRKALRKNNPLHMASSERSQTFPPEGHR